MSMISLRPGDGSAGSRQPLPKGAGDDIDTTHNAPVFMCSATGLSEEA